MPDRPFPIDDAVLARWMKLEVSKINEGLVAVRVPLSSLREETTPIIPTKDGKHYKFNKKTLTTLGSMLPRTLQEKLRLPVFCYFDSAVGDSCFVTDPYAVEVLQQLHEISNQREMVDGRLWIGKPIIYGIMRKYPTFLQIVMR